MEGTSAMATGNNGSPVMQTQTVTVSISPAFSFVRNLLNRHKIFIFPIISYFYAGYVSMMVWHQSIYLFLLAF